MQDLLFIGMDSKHILDILGQDFLTATVQASTPPANLRAGLIVKLLARKLC